MSRVLTNEQNYYDIANTIRQMKNVNTTYKPREMASALKDIYSNEVEGVLPLSFESNGMPLIDYRIDGASGGVGDRTKNLFDENAITNEILKDNDGTTNSNNNWRCSNFINIPQNNNNILISWESDSAYFQAKIAFYDNQKNFISLSNYGINNTYLITFSLTNNCEFIRFSYSQTVNNVPANRHNIQIILGSTATDYEPYGYKVPVVVSGNNLAKWDTHLQPQTNGIVLNDTNSISSIIDVTNINNIYIFGDRTKLNSNVYRIGKSNEPISLNSQTTRITYAGGILDTSDCNYVIVSCSIYNTETTFDDIKNSFMIVEGTTSPDNFEPYHEPTTTNIYLDEPIEANESISLSDTNVDIPTIDGTNVITIDTTVQPSNVYIQAPKDTPKMIEARERLEVI